MKSLAFTTILIVLLTGLVHAADPSGEDSKGLWEINVDRKPKGGRDNLRAKVQGKKAGKGTDISPWTVTHSGRPASKQKGKGFSDGTGQLKNFELQQGTARYQRSVTRRSNAAKKQDETKKGIVRKLQ